MKASLTVIDISNEVAETNSYKNIPLSQINNHVIRLSVMTESYYWHYHPNSDETFYVVEGLLLIDLEDKTIELKTGQLFTIPANVKHRTRPGQGRSVNLTFELANLETIKC